MATKGLQTVDTEQMNACREAFDAALNAYRTHKDDVKTAVEELLECWSGEGKDAFKKDYLLLTKQLEDLMDVLLDLRKGIVDAEESFIEADAKVSKEIASA